MTKLDFMKAFIKENAFTAATLQFDGLRREAMRILKLLENAENFKDSETYINNFHAIIFTPFKKQVDEINLYY